MGYYLKWGFIGLLLTMFAAVLHYSIPQWDIVRISDTYEKRVNPGSNSWFWAAGDVGDANAGNSRDVFFIQARRSNDDAIVYRNEDRPLYFKFDTADLQADAVDLRSTPEAPKWVGVKHYGWRNEFLSIYPNALRIKSVDGPDARIIPWMSIAMLAVIVMIVWAITSRLIRFSRRRIAPVVDRVDEGASSLWARMRGR